jgi:hypothetical protein
MEYLKDRMFSPKPSSTGSSAWPAVSISPQRSKLMRFEGNDKPYTANTNSQASIVGTPGLGGSTFIDSSACSPVIIDSNRSSMISYDGENMPDPLSPESLTSTIDNDCSEPAILTGSSSGYATNETTPDPEFGIDAKIPNTPRGINGQGFSGDGSTSNELIPEYHTNLGSFESASPTPTNSRPSKRPHSSRASSVGPEIQPYNNPYDSLSLHNQPATCSRASHPRKRPALKSFVTDDQLHKRPASAALDRFIPIRRSPTSSTKSFYMNKPLDQLTMHERTYRKRDVSPDPFVSAPPTIIDQMNRQTPRVLSGSGPRNVRSGTSGTGILGLRHASAGNNRQVSAGSIWNVGGAIYTANAQTGGVLNGHGGWMGSGTNAPMFTSHFIEEKTPEVDNEQHEGRLATAFGFDRIGKVLTFDTLATNDGDKVQSDKYSKTPGTVRRKRFGGYSETRTIWRDSTWILDGTKIRKLAPPYLTCTFMLTLEANARKVSQFDSRKAVPITPFR